MTALRIIFVFSLIAVIIGAAAIAGEDQEGQKSEMTAEGMPPMGPPEEMQQIAHLAGTWDVTQDWKMDPSDQEWQTSEGVAKYEMILGGAAMRHTFDSEMMGMPFEGLGLLAFNRETEKWQQTWTDNMGAHISYYEGHYKDGKMVFTHEAVWQGQKYQDRITIHNIKDNSFDWTYELSMDGGKTWHTTGKAQYTKRN